MCLPASQPACLAVVGILKDIVGISGLPMSSSSAAASSSTASSQFTYSNNTYFPTPFHLQQPQSYVGQPTAIPQVQLSAPTPVVPTVYQPVYSLPQFQQVYTSNFEIFDLEVVMLCKEFSRLSGFVTLGQFYFYFFQCHNIKLNSALPAFKCL